MGGFNLYGVGGGQVFNRYFIFFLDIKSSIDEWALNKVMTLSGEPLQDLNNLWRLCRNGPRSDLIFWSLCPLQGGIDKTRFNLCGPSPIPNCSFPKNEAAFKNTVRCLVEIMHHIYICLLICYLKFYK